MKQLSVCIGIDVSLDSLDVAVRPTKEFWSAPNTEAGIKEVVSKLETLCPEVVVIENTGGIETPIVIAASLAGLPITAINPRQIRDFAKATGTLAKTDKLDAHVIAHFGDAIRPEIRPVKEEDLRYLTDLLTRRKQLVDMLTSEKNRLYRSSKQIAKDIKPHISWLEKRLKSTDSELKKRVKDNPLWCEKDEICQSVPGVGPILSLSLLSNLPELGSVNSKQVAALVGVAPFNHDSGKHRGRRIVWGGRAKVRSVLYMATMTAVRFNSALKDFYERLRNAGKKPKIALTACMRKLIIILNAMIRDGVKWQEKPAQNA